MDLTLYVLRAVALLNVLLLLILYVVISSARKRQERVERKIDMIGLRLGLGPQFDDLDDETGRRSSYAPLE